MITVKNFFRSFGLFWLISGVLLFTNSIKILFSREGAGDWIFSSLPTYYLVIIGFALALLKIKYIFLKTIKNKRSKAFSKSFSFQSVMSKKDLWVPLIMISTGFSIRAFLSKDLSSIITFSVGFGLIVGAIYSFMISFKTNETSTNKETIQEVEY